MTDEIKGKYGKRLAERGQRMFSQFEGAEMLAEAYGITREEMDASAVSSHAKALAATNAGYFKREIVVLQGKDKDGNTVVHDKDEGIRPGTTMAKQACLAIHCRTRIDNTMHQLFTQ